MTAVELVQPARLHEHTRALEQELRPGLVVHAGQSGEPHDRGPAAFARAQAGRTAGQRALEARQVRPGALAHPRLDGRNSGEDAGQRELRGGRHREVGVGDQGQPGQCGLDPGLRPARHPPGELPLRQESHLREPGDHEAEAGSLPERRGQRRGRRAEGVVAEHLVDHQRELPLRAGALEGSELGRGQHGSGGVSRRGGEHRARAGFGPQARAQRPQVDVPAPVPAQRIVDQSDAREGRQVVE